MIDETFDGEAVLVHLGTGRYYALNAAGTAIWELVRDGRAPGEVVELLGGDRGADVAVFLDQLLGEGLLVGGNGAAPAPVAEGVNGDEWTDPPTLQRFDDLEDLLLVDPIHDVTLGADGWPVSAEK